MSSISLPALQIRPPEQQPDVLEQFGRLQALKNQAQEAPLRRQALQQQVQAGQQNLQQGQLEIQAQQQKVHDSQILSTLSPQFLKKDPNGNVGYDYDGLFGAAQANGVSPATVTALQEGVAKVVSSKAAASKAKRDEEEAFNLQAFQHIEGLRGTQDPAQRQQVWQSAMQWAQQNQGILKNLGIDASKLSPQAPDDNGLTALEASLGMHAQTLADAGKRAEIAQTEQKTKDMQQAAERGGTTEIDKFSFDWMKSKGLPNTPENRQKAFEEYTRQTKIAPQQVRVEGFGNIRELPVIDTNTNSLQYLNANDINAANKNEPGRYVPAGEGVKALNKMALLEDIRGNINQVRSSLNDPKLPEFTADQRAQISIAINNEHARDAISSAFRGGVLGSLTPEQQEYLINMAQLKENAMAMRSVLGAGQGSEDLRDAIVATIPGPRTPSKAYGKMQLDKFENTLNRLGKGIPGGKLTQAFGGQSSGAAPAPTSGLKVGDPVKLKNGQTIIVKVVHPDGSFD